MSREHHPSVVISAEQLELAHLFASGKQTGFADVLTNLQGAQVINVQVRPENARDWLVTLGAMKNSGQPAASGKTVANVPPDNQVAIALGASAGAGPEVANYNIRGVYVKVFYGTGNAIEQAFVSWPFGGCTLPLHGALVRVEIPPGFNLGNLNAHQFLPMLSGFISPSARRDGGQQSPPTLLTSIKAMANAAAQTAGVDFWAPPRACGYRLYTTVDLDTVFSPLVRVKEALWLGGLPTSTAAMAHTNASLYRGNSNTLDTSVGQGFQRATGQPNDWRRIMPGSVGLHIDVANPQNGFDVAVGVEWMLDLG